MIKHIQSATGLRRPRYWGSVVLRLLLLFSAWQGPIAWFHCHGSLTEARESQAWLAKHLQTHHPNIPLFSAVDFGWHFHVDLPVPCSEDGEKEAPKPCLAASTVRPLTSVVASVDCSWFPSYIPFAANLHGLPLPRLAIAEFTQHFFDGFADYLALPLRFCVALN